MSHAARLVISLVLLAVGTFGLCCGLLPGVLMPLLLNQDIARVERLQPLPSALAEDGAPGDEALIEGTLSPRNPTSPEGLIIYTHSERKIRSGDWVWTQTEFVRPPVLVEVPGGTVRVGGDYRVDGNLPSAVWTARDRFDGLRAGDAVMVVGTLVAGEEGVELRADLLAMGTRDVFLQSKRDASFVSRIFGLSAVGAGLVLFAPGLVMLVLALRSRARPVV